MKFKVTAFWNESSQAMVVEAENAESAKQSVQWVEDPSVAVEPTRIEIELTNEPLGLQPYIHVGPMGWRPK